MPKFSDKSKSTLGTAHEDLQTLFNEVVKNFDCTIIEGYRDNIKQNEYYRRGLSKLKGGESKHNASPSLAVDAVPYPSLYSDKELMIFFAGYVLGVSDSLYKEKKIKHKIRWGGDWNSDKEFDKFFDAAHYELEG